MPNTPTQRSTTIDISKEAIKFSAAHFTIFNATERERLHGHNFRVRATVVAAVDENGMCFNYQEIKKRLMRICDGLDEYVLLPDRSPHMAVTLEGPRYTASFNGETLLFPKSDTLLLPIANSTVEELSFYILNRLMNQDQFFNENAVESIEIGVSSGDGQWGSSHWQKD